MGRWYEAYPQLQPRIVGATPRTTTPWTPRCRMENNILGKLRVTVPLHNWPLPSQNGCLEDKPLVLTRALLYHYVSARRGNRGCRKIRLDKRMFPPPILLLLLPHSSQRQPSPDMHIDQTACLQQTFCYRNMILPRRCIYYEVISLDPRCVQFRFASKARRSMGYQVQFILALENICNKLLVVPKPARVSALRAELTGLNHMLPAEASAECLTSSL